jgi:hypothetical protein
VIKLAELITQEQGKEEMKKVFQKVYDKLLTPTEAMSEVEKIAETVE